MMCCFCSHYPGNDPALNPYWVECLITVTILVHAFHRWRRIRPTPHAPLRVAAGAGALLVLVAMWSICTDPWPEDVRDRPWMLALGSALVIAVCLQRETALSTPPPPIPPAIASGAS